LVTRATTTRRDDVPNTTSAVLPITAASIRLFLHVLAATVWVGGQLTLAGLVPGLRAISTDAPRIAARSFNRIAWPAFGVLVATGIWNIAEVKPTWDSDYGHTLILKLAVVALSGLTALAHAHSRSRIPLAVFGALTAVSALGALFLGVLLVG
jgi:putative copper export protein